MTKAKKSSRSPAIADVAHPGTSAPSDTSKSIINQRPMMKDPMVVEDDKPETKQTLSKRASEAKIVPPGEQSKDDQSEEDAPAPEAKSKPEPEPETKSEPETAEGEEKDSEKSVEKATAEPSGDGKPEPKTSPDAAEAAAKAEADAKLLKLVEDKKYFLPINAVEHRRSARFTAMGIILALVLAVAWADIALDAGLIHLGSVKPVTHLFSN